MTFVHQGRELAKTAAKEACGNNKRKAEALFREGAARERAAPRPRREMLEEPRPMTCL